MLRPNTPAGHRGARVPDPVGDPTGTHAFQDPDQQIALGYVAGALDRAIREERASQREVAEMISWLAGRIIPVWNAVGPHAGNLFPPALPPATGTMIDLVDGDVATRTPSEPPAWLERGLDLGSDQVEARLDDWNDAEDGLSPLAVLTRPGVINDAGRFVPIPDELLGRDQVGNYEDARHRVYLRGVR